MDPFFPAQVPIPHTRPMFPRLTSTPVSVPYSLSRSPVPNGFPTLLLFLGERRSVSTLLFFSLVAPGRHAQRPKHESFSSFFQEVIPMPHLCAKSCFFGVRQDNLRGSPIFSAPSLFRRQLVPNASVELFLQNTTSLLVGSPVPLPSVRVSPVFFWGSTEISFGAGAVLHFFLFFLDFFVL